jgi:hypothetical protein
VALTPVYGLNKQASAATAWDGPLNGDFDTLDDVIARPKIVQNAPTVGATTTLDLLLARVFVFTLNQNTTIAFSNVPAATFSVRILLLITNGAAFTLTWPASVTWLAGNAPVLQVAGNDVVELMTRDGGTVWVGSIWTPKNLTMSGVLKSVVGTSTTQAKPSQVLFQDLSKTTTSGVDVSLTSFSLPANSLSANGQAVRIIVGGLGPAGGALVNIRFGATTATGTFTLGANDNFWLSILVTRTGAATQVSSSSFTKNVAPLAGANATFPIETLSGAVTIDFRGNVTVGGQTLTYHTVQVEYLAA